MSKFDIHCKTFGDKNNPALLFLHAFPFTGEMWRDQVEICSRDFYCLVPDLPGFGKSSLPATAVTFEAYVDSIFDYLQKNDISKSIWCGLSMGGYLALRMYERDHELCQALILCDTKSGADSTEAKLKRWDSIKALEKNRDEFIQAQWSALTSKKSQTNDELKKRIEGLISGNSNAGITQGLVALATRTESIVTLAKIRVPSLIIVGEDDIVTPVGESTAMNQAIESSQLQVIRDAGHLSNLEQPQLFNRALTDFLKQLT
jgi:3-oxoadipate enol-lactonase